MLNAVARRCRCPTKNLMPPKKKTKVAGLSTDVVAVTIDQLDDVLANIFGWLRVQEIMGKRCVCKKWKKAVKKTIVPPDEHWTRGFCVGNVKEYNAMAVMTRALPNLQQIAICGFREDGHRWSDGEDPDERVAADNTTHDIEIISNFSKLRILTIWCDVVLNGRYPVFFNFPFLQKLSIIGVYGLKFDLDMLAGLPSLKELECWSNDSLTGNINSLRVLKDTLQNLNIDECYGVDGNFMDLADFPHLKELTLGRTHVTGDIRDIRENDFSSLEYLELPYGVCGGKGYELQNIADASDLVRAVYLLEKQRPGLFHLEVWYVKLSGDSPDWYESAEEDDQEPPFSIQLVQAGSRIGYRWTSNYFSRGLERICFSKPCEVNWLDPEPNRESIGYKEYIAEKRKLDRMVELYKGFYEPPTEEEYTRLIEDIGGVASRTRARQGRI
jgi:hypothetical protein